MQTYTVQTIGYLVAGAGIDQIKTDVHTGLLLVGVGVLIEVLVAVLNRFNIVVQAKQ